VHVTARVYVAALAAARVYVAARVHVAALAHVAAQTHVAARAHLVVWLAVPLADLPLAAPLADAYVCMAVPHPPMI